jgi:hypothetical protein
MYFIVPKKLTEVRRAAFDSKNICILYIFEYNNPTVWYRVNIVALYLGGGHFQCRQ